MKNMKKTINIALLGLLTLVLLASFVPTAMCAASLDPDVPDSDININVGGAVTLSAVLPDSDVNGLEETDDAVETSSRTTVATILSLFSLIFGAAAIGSLVPFIGIKKQKN